MGIFGEQIDPSAFPPETFTAAVHTTTDHTGLPGVVASIDVAVQRAHDYSLVPAHLSLQYPWGGTPVVIPNPVLPPGTVQGWEVSFSPSGEYSVISGDAGGIGFALLFQRSGRVFTSLGNVTNGKYAWTYADGRILVAIAAYPSPNIGWFLEGVFTGWIALGIFPCIPVSLAWSPNGQFLAAGCQPSNQPGPFGSVAVIVWERVGSTFTLLPMLPNGGMGGSSNSNCAWSPDGLYLIVTNDQSTARLWRRDGSVFTYMQDIPMYRPSAVAFDPRGEHVLFTSNSSELLIAPFADGVVGLAVSLGAGVSIAWSPDGQHFAAGLHWPQDSVRVFSRNGLLVTDIPVAAYPRRVAWSPDGQYVIAAIEGIPSFVIIQTGLDMPATGMLRQHRIARDSA